ncbi:Diphthamide biosynthesis protein 2 [Dispira parvispora]|uniref:2-(3-amino-3-carboxypropyl)histidine synthase subunit 2 n=1 Tax=Dispira parvispora TaxID=1520584 RepID=A0A9W8AKG0_9FUNG|nr:Diphthamide biosynthesis protein 2 [Dispira parvispora]
MTTELTTSVPMADTGADVIQRQVTEKSQKQARTLSEYYDFYDIERTCQTIRDFGYQRVALQFPDTLLADATVVYQALRKNTSSEIFVLADTSYGSCCVDEVAADHVQADLIIHYGHTCLSAPSRIPVLYVFGKAPIDLDEACRAISNAFSSEKSRRLLLLYDVAYHHAMGKFGSNDWVMSWYNLNMVNGSPMECDTAGRNNSNCCQRSSVASVPLDPPKDSTPLVNSESSPHSHGGRDYNLPSGTLVQDYTLVYIGEESLTLSHIILTHQPCPIYSFNPTTHQLTEQTPKTSKALMRRYVMMQKARDADTIGIVAGTLGVAAFRDVLTHLKQIIQASGKKYYEFVMGKLNVAKLANFMEIDVFVLVACPENSLIDSKEFYRPVVTPFELQLSLQTELEWTGRFVTDFQTLLEDHRSKYEATCLKSPAVESGIDGVHDNDEEGDEDDDPHFSVITGRLQSNRRRHHRVQYDNETGSVAKSQLIAGMDQMTVRDSQRQVATTLGSTAGEYFLERTFRGLEQRLGETEASEVQEGRRGIARGYQSEKRE